MVTPSHDVLWAYRLRHSYQGSPALLGASLAVRQGEILGVLGPRGAGKTTLLRCLSGMLLPDQGEVWFNSLPVHALSPAARERLRRNRFGWVGSTPQLVPELTVHENAALPLLLCGVPHHTARNTAQGWLDRLDVGAAAHTRPAALTQAERQRVALARALVTLPRVVFADEPTAPLHSADGSQLLRTLTIAARSHGITVVLATSDPGIASLADRAVTLIDGRQTGPVARAGASQEAPPGPAPGLPPGRSMPPGPQSRGDAAPCSASA